MAALGDRAQCGPDKATEFSGHGGDGDVAVFFVIKAVELFVETVLGLDGDGDDIGRLPVSPTFEY